MSLSLKVGDVVIAGKVNAKKEYVLAIVTVVAFSSDASDKFLGRTERGTETLYKRTQVVYTTAKVEHAAEQNVQLTPVDVGALTPQAIEVDNFQTAEDTAVEAADADIAARNAATAA